MLSRFVAEVTAIREELGLEHLHLLGDSRGGEVALEYMWGPSEFVATGKLREYDRIGQLSRLKIPTLFLAGEYDEARPATMREFQ